MQELRESIYKALKKYWADFPESEDRNDEKLLNAIMGGVSHELHDPSQRPKHSDDTREFSVDVFTIDEHGLPGLAYFSFEDDRWRFHTDTLVDYNEHGNETRWNWYYPPITKLH
jgi:hypothetical protein